MTDVPERCSKSEMLNLKENPSQGGVKTRHLSFAFLYINVVQI